MSFRSAYVYFALGCLATSSAGADSYLLHPGDHVQVRVSELRPGATEVHQWDVFDNKALDFIVASDGRLSLPLVGEIAAAGQTTADVAEAIATQLQAKAGLIAKPDASVQIVRFSPFYVAGGVEKPGEYEFRPGLTVLQAASMAGGPPRLSTDTLIGLEKDALSSRGDLSVFSAEYVSLLARQARVDAEIAGAAAIAVPAELQSQAGAAIVSRAIHEETLLFESQRNALIDQIRAQEQNKSFLQEEIKQLRKKDESVSSQLVASQKEFDLIEGLVKKGLSNTARELELQQNIGQTQGNLLDVQVAITRANEDLAKADGSIKSFSAKYKGDALEESQRVRVQLQQTTEKMRTAQALVFHSEVRAPEMVKGNVDDYAHPNYVLSRRDKSGKTTSVSAAEDDEIEPGDVLRRIAARGGLENGRKPSARLARGELGFGGCVGRASLTQRR